jgi:branched-chain amino acid aminotransferase
MAIIATQEAKRNGYEEAILLDHKGNVSEAPGENIFIVRDGRLITPPLSSSALEGITRDSIIKIGRDLNFEVSEKFVTKSDLISSDEIFLTGTAAEITPIISMDGNKIGNGRPGDITKKMMDEYTNIVMNKNNDYSSWLTPVY